MKSGMAEYTRSSTRSRRAERLLSVFGATVSLLITGCIITHESDETRLDNSQHSQLPGDDGNGSIKGPPFRRWDILDEKGALVGAALATGVGENQVSPDTPKNAEVWRWEPTRLESLARGEVPELIMHLTYDPLEWDKREAYEAFYGETAGWPSWSCGRLFDFDERRMLEGRRSEGVVVYRVRSASYGAGPKHLLELRFDPDTPADVGPAAYFHLDAAATDDWLARAGRGPHDLTVSEAFVDVDKARLVALDDGDAVEVIPLMPKEIRGGDCRHAVH